MPIFTRQIDNVDTLPPGSGSVDPAPWPVRTPHASTHWLLAGVVGLFLLLMTPLCYWLFASDVRYWYRYGGGDSIVNAVLTIGGGLAALFLVRKIVLVDAAAPQVALWRLNAQETVNRALDVQLSYAENTGRNTRAMTYAPTYHHQVESSTAEQLALPAPEDLIALTPDSDWLRWVDRAPHLILAGRTGAGKTTMANAILAERITAGDQLLICDPHWQPGKWFDLPAIASVEAILETLPSIISEMDARYTAYKAGRATEEFDRLTVLIDEVPAIVDRCFELTASGKPKVIDWRWPRFARKLGSEARAVRISVMLLSQSTLVQDLMINVQMRRNFTRIGLGDQARPLLNEEPQSKRRQQLLDLLRGQQYPAAMEHHGDYHLLDTSNVQVLSERSVRSLARPWDATQAARPNSTADLLSGLLDEPLSTNGHGPASFVRPIDALRATMPGSSISIGRTDGRTVHQDRMRVYLKALAASGKSREYARSWADAKGLQFENKLWTEVRDELGLR